MLDNTSLISLYRQEKGEVMDVIGDDTFPSFNKWKTNYMEEYNDSHADSSFLDVSLALELTDAEIGILPAG